MPPGKNTKGIHDKPDELTLEDCQRIAKEIDREYDQHNDRLLHFIDLETVTPYDQVLLNDIEKALKIAERKAKSIADVQGIGSLGDDAKRRAEGFRRLYEAALANFAIKPHAEAASAERRPKKLVDQEKRLKLVRELEARRQAGIVAEEDAKKVRDEKTAREAAEFVERQVNMALTAADAAREDAKQIGVIKKRFELLGKLFVGAENDLKDENPRDAKFSIDSAVQALASETSIYNGIIEASVEQGFTPKSVPYLVFYKEQIDVFDAKIAELSAREVAMREEQENTEKESKKRHEIGERFRGLVDVYKEKVIRVTSLPISTLDEVSLAKSELEGLKNELNAFFKLYESEVRSIVAPLFAKEKNDLTPAERRWIALDGDRAKIKKDFFGSIKKDNKTGEEVKIKGVYSIRDEQLLACRNELRELHHAGQASELEAKSREHQAIWEAQFPAFELAVAHLSNQFFNAEMLGGKERKKALEKLHSELIVAEGEWKVLRESGPRRTEKEREEGKTSSGEVMDRRLTGMRNNLDELLPVAERALGIKLKTKSWDKLASDWMRSFVKVSQFWNSGASFQECFDFLEDFIGNGMPEDHPGLTRLIKESERPTLVALIKSSTMYDELLKIIEDKKHDLEQEERELERASQERRANLSCTLLDMLRRTVSREAEKIRNAPFWKKKISEKAGGYILRNGVVMDDEELENVVSDIPAFRAAIASLNNARDAARKCEDDMLMVSNADGKLSVEQLRGFVAEYTEKFEASSTLYRAAISAEGWGKIEKEHDRRGKMIGFDKSGWDITKQVKDPAYSLIVAWSKAKALSFATRDFVREILDKNEGVALEIEEELPKDLRKNPRQDVKTAVDSSVHSVYTDPDSEDDADIDDPVGAANTLAAFRAGRRPKHSPDAGVAPITSSVSHPVIGGPANPNPIVPDAVVVMSQKDIFVLKRKNALIKDENQKLARKLLSDDVFWIPYADGGLDAGGRASKIKFMIRGILDGQHDAFLKNTNGLREDRIDDFRYASAFIDIEDLVLRISFVHSKYTAAVAAPFRPLAPMAVDEPIVPAPAAEPIIMGSPSGSGAYRSGPTTAPISSLVPDVKKSPAGSFPIPSSLFPLVKKLPPIRPSLLRPQQSQVPPQPQLPAELSAEVHSPIADASQQVPSEPVVTPRVDTVPPPQELTSLSGEPYERFFGTGPVPAVAAEQQRDSRVVTPVVYDASRTETPSSETPQHGREVAPVRAATILPSSIIRPSSPGEPLLRRNAVREPEIRQPEPTRNPVELRVSSWATSIRNTVGRWFGADVGGIAAREITGMPTERERRGEAPSSTEVAYRTIGSVFSVVGTLFGLKSLVDVPRYLSQSFCTANERALLQADILEAMEANVNEKQRAGSDPEASTRANIEAAQRTDRAIAVSAYLTDEQKVEMRARVAELQEKYTERTRENMAARSRDLANVLESAVQNRVTGWGAAKEVEDKDARFAAIGFSPAVHGAGNGVMAATGGITYGVMAFRERFEKAATKNPEASFVGNVADSFRSVWTDTWGKLTKKTNSKGEFVVNAGEAMATVATAVGMAALTIGVLEDALPGLRLAAGGESDVEGVTSLIAEGRQKLQDMVDKVLPAYERLAKRTA